LIIDERIQESPNAYSSDDEHRIWLIDQPTGAKKQLSGSWGKFGSVDSVSDDGRFVAVTSWTRTTTRKSEKSRSNYVADLQNGKIVGSDFDGSVSGWTGSGDSTQAFLKKWSLTKGGMEYCGSVAVTTGISTTVLPNLLPFRLQAGASPDGTSRFIIHPNNSMEIQRPDGSTQGRFVFHPDDAHFATADSLSWCGSQYLLFKARYPAVIDATTMKMSYLPDEFAANTQFEFSSDFNRAAVEEKDGLHIARISRPQVAASQP
jgi:hypothetical protein